ncbi:hypothetical protein GCM10010912_17220 [Paenibacillus albidus]|uniref:Accessory regulator AgrB n=1 Tax=Paenibacillus albidus TaxID=2041023 RepID=A0A917FET5_9BACL|nr:accessory gene regulator B family protein [Paenibacillus albidus]GGF72596.1 hypothetical protein GCM10010912_17220 [Paenibacillus albidus]
MIEALALKFALSIKKHAPTHPASVDVLKFSLSILINATTIVLLSFLISGFTNKVPEMAFSLVSFALLRQISGGVHLKSGMYCVALTTALMTLISFSDFGFGMTTAFNAIGILLALAYAPSRIERQSRIPKKYYPLLKVASVFLIGLNFIINSPVIAAGFLAQALTLIKLRR